MRRWRRGAGVVLIGAALATAAWLALLPPDAAWIESCYVRQLYPRLLRCTVPLTEWTGASLTEILLAVLLLVGLAAVVRAGRAVRRSQATVARALGAVAFTAGVIAAGLYLAFLIEWGLLYYRPSLAQRRHWPRGAATEATVRALATRLADDARAGRVLVEPADVAAASGALVTAVREVAHELDALEPRLPQRVKHVWPPGLLAITGTTGITSPWLHEAQIDPKLLPLEQPFVMAHELAHVAGFAPEAEANLVGYLACLRSGSQAARYSAQLALLPAAIGSLEADAQAELVAAVDPDVRADLRAIAARARRDQSVLLARASRKLYDAYLKQQGVVAGIHDYARVVELLVAYERAARAR